MQFSTITVGLFVLIRRAQIQEDDTLSRIALTGKAHWGYCAEDLSRWEADLIVSPDSLVQLTTFVAVLDELIAGFYQLSFVLEEADLEDLWVLPAHMGKGIGRTLLKHAVLEVTARGKGNLLIDADPNAEGFYVACGAVRTGKKAAPTVGQSQSTRPQPVLLANAT